MPAPLAGFSPWRVALGFASIQDIFDPAPEPGGGFGELVQIGCSTLSTASVSMALTGIDGWLAISIAEGHLPLGRVLVIAKLGAMAWMYSSAKAPKVGMSFRAFLRASLAIERLLGLSRHQQLPRLQRLLARFASELALGGTAEAHLLRFGLPPACSASIGEHPSLADVIGKRGRDCRRRHIAPAW